MITQVPYTSRDSDPKEISLIHRTGIPNTVIYGMLCEQGGMPLMTHVSMPSVMSMPSMMSLPQMTFAQPQQPHQVRYRTGAYRIPSDPTVLRIWDPVPFFGPLDPEWVKNQDSDSGIEHLGSYFQELGNNFLG
jgi:hypothetical protein